MRVAAQTQPSVRYLHGFEHLNGASPSAGRAFPPMHAQQLSDLAADVQVGIQGGHGILKHHTDPIATDLIQCVAAQTHQFLAAKPNAALHACRATIQAEDGQQQLRFPGGGLADDAEAFVRLQLQCHLAYRRPVAHGDRQRLYL